MARWPGAEAIYDVADLFRHRCLVGGTSLLWPEHRAWTPENLEALWDAFIGSPDMGSGTFYEKWQNQLDGQPEDVHRIATDVIAFYHLFPSNIGRTTKLEDVKRVLGWKLAAEQPDLQGLESAYSTAIGNPGMYYLTGRPWQVGFYLKFAHRLRVEGVDPHDSATCRRLADEARLAIPQGGSADPARHILLHLFFPERYERIASTAHKRRIAKAFAQHAPGVTDTDDALLQIRTALAQQHGRPRLDFYDDNIEPLWNDVPKASAAPKPQVRYSKEALQRLIAYFKVQLVSFESARYLEEERDYKVEASKKVRMLLSEERLRGLIERGAFEEAKTEIKRAASGNNLLNQFDTLPIRNAPAEQLARSLYDLLYGEEAFASRFDAWVDVLAQVKRGCWPAVTYFLMLDEPERHLLLKPMPISNLLSELESDIAWESRPTIRLYGRIQQMAQALLPELAYLGARDMIDIHSFIWRVQGVSDDDPGADSGGISSGTASGAKPFSRDTIFDQLVMATHLSVDELRELESIVVAKKQVILEGPPGSGKTFVAQKFARYFTGNQLDGLHDERVEIVQFHQAYGYEDFIQGIRPETNEERQIEYRVRDGIFKRMCQLAERNPDEPFVLIIDEINRGNIARIFGELLFLLEYRNEGVSLPYAAPGEPPFRIPPNVHLLGTMNTTDRSLAQIDYALRRRFYFYRLLPMTKDRAPVLEAWLDRTDLTPESREQVLGLFLNLNRRLDRELGEDYQVGHSYFMTADIGVSTELHRIWRRAIMPRLREYFHGARSRSTLLDELSIERLSEGISSTASEE